MLWLIPVLVLLAIGCLLFSTIYWKVNRLEDRLFTLERRLDSAQSVRSKLVLMENEDEID